MSENEGFSYREKDNTNRYVLVNIVDVKKFKTYFIPIKPGNTPGPGSGKLLSFTVGDFRNQHIKRLYLRQAINLYAKNWKLGHLSFSAHCGTKRETDGSRSNDNKKPVGNNRCPSKPEQSLS
jgi:hypothetical protein